MATATKTRNGTTNSDISIEDLSAQLEILKNDIAVLTSTMGAYGKAKAAEARDTANSKASEIRDSAQARAEELSAAGIEKTKEAHKHAEDFVRTQPGTAIGIAAGVGFLVGLLTARR